jgi:two-component system chemotaxis response regulator CheB
MCLSVLLTGMGRDGAAAMLRLRQNGARCLAQDEASSVVFGMPRAALHIGAAEAAVPIADMARQILALTRGEALAVQRGMAV